MSKLDLSKLRPGDIIKGVRTMKVVSVGQEFTYLEDVSDKHFGLFRIRTDGSDAGSWRYEMVKRAVRPKPYPVKVKAGDVLTGAQVKARPWKRGTHLLGVFGGHHFILTENGDWYSPAQYPFEGPEFVPFERFPDWGKYQVLHVA